MSSSSSDLKLSNIYHASAFNPKIKIKILLCRPYSFTMEVVGRNW